MLDVDTLSQNGHMQTNKSKKKVGIINTKCLSPFTAFTIVLFTHDKSTVFSPLFSSSSFLPTHEKWNTSQQRKEPLMTVAKTQTPCSGLTSFFGCVWERKRARKGLQAYGQLYVLYVLCWELMNYVFFK